MEDIAKSSYFDEAINKYLIHIESLWTSLPVVLRTIERTQNLAITEQNDFLNNHCEYIKQEDHF